MQRGFWALIGAVAAVSTLGACDSGKNAGAGILSETQVQHTFAAKHLLREEHPRYRGSYPPFTGHRYQFLLGKSTDSLTLGSRRIEGAPAFVVVIFPTQAAARAALREPKVRGWLRANREPFAVKDNVVIVARAPITPATEMRKSGVTRKLLCCRCAPRPSGY